MDICLASCDAYARCEPPSAYWKSEFDLANACKVQGCLPKRGQFLADAQKWDDDCEIAQEHHREVVRCLEESECDESPTCIERVWSEFAEAHAWYCRPQR